MKLHPDIDHWHQSHCLLPLAWPIGWVLIIISVQESAQIVHGESPFPWHLNFANHMQTCDKLCGMFQMFVHAAPVPHVASWHCVYTQTQQKLKIVYLLTQEMAIIHTALQHVHYVITQLRWHTLLYRYTGYSYSYGTVDASDANSVTILYYLSIGSTILIKLLLPLAYLANVVLFSWHSTFTIFRHPSSWC